MLGSSHDRLDCNPRPISCSAGSIVLICFDTVHSARKTQQRTVVSARLGTRSSYFGSVWSRSTPAPRQLWRWSHNKRTRPEECFCVSLEEPEPFTRTEAERRFVAPSLRLRLPRRSSTSKDWPNDPFFSNQCPRHLHCSTDLSHRLDGRRPSPCSATISTTTIAGPVTSLV